MICIRCKKDKSSHLFYPGTIKAHAEGRKSLYCSKCLADMHGQEYGKERQKIVINGHRWQRGLRKEEMKESAIQAMRRAERKRLIESREARLAKMRGLNAEG